MSSEPRVMHAQLLPSPATPTMPRDSEARELARVLRGILQLQTQTRDPDPFDLSPSNGPGLFPRLAPQDQLEEYVNELVRALQLVNKIDKLDLGHRQEFAADAVLVRKAIGIDWSQALSTTLANSSSNDRPERRFQERRDAMEVLRKFLTSPRSKRQLVSYQQILTLVQAVSMGACVLPMDEEGPNGELMYIRAGFESVVGSKDFEVFYMMNVDGTEFQS